MCRSVTSKTSKTKWGARGNVPDKRKTDSLVHAFLRGILVLHLPQHDFNARRALALLPQYPALPIRPIKSFILQSNLTLACVSLTRYLTTESLSPAHAIQSTEQRPTRDQPPCTQYRAPVLLNSSARILVTRVPRSRWEIGHVSHQPPIAYSTYR